MSRPQIAVLDDEANMRVALGRLLRHRGYEVAEFELGPELLDACLRRTVNCIILDLHMPEMDGYEVLSRLARHATPPPVIVITGHDSPGNAERVFRLGAHAYFTKPVDAGPLFESIRSAIDAPSETDPGLD